MAAPKPPNGFTSLTVADGRLGRLHDIIGICVDHVIPFKSRGTDFTAIFTLCDPGWSNGLGMKFHLFNGQIDRLPQIQQNGDALILRKVKTTEHKGQLVGMSNSSTSWVMLSGQSIQESICPNGSDIEFITSRGVVGRAPAPSVDELKYIKEIRRMIDPTSFKPPPRPVVASDVAPQTSETGETGQPRKEKWRLIQDLTLQSNGAHNFADLFGEVRKTWNSDYGRMTLSLTDYTSNKRLYNYSNEPQSRDGDEFGHTSSSHEKWPGPWGRMTIEVLLFDAHAGYARSQVKVGMYVLIKNCQIKLDMNGSRLEAACRGDRDDVLKVNISIHNPHQAHSDDRFKGLLKRRIEYEKHAKTKGLRFGFDKAMDQDSTKRSIDILNIAEAGADVSAQEKQPKKTKRRERKKKTAANILEQSEAVVANGVSRLNQNVRCNKIEVPVKAMTDILDPEILKRETLNGRGYYLPYQNCCYKTRLRVVDYYPQDIADFSVPRLVTEYDALSDAEDTDDFHLTLTAAQNNPHSVRWEWRFFLVVEDASLPTKAAATPQKQMVLLVADTDGDYLLREEACDLRANPQNLATLRERLFVLWGNLQEEKEKAALESKNFITTVQSIPFECLIKEYGISDSRLETNASAKPNFQRMFRMHWTTIVLDG